MESIKNIEIQDLETVLKFRIRLFDCEKGLDFLDKVIELQQKEGSSFSIKPLLDDLLPLASMLDATGTTVVKERLTRQDCYSLFQNPLAILELGVEIFKFQQVFTQNSKLFQASKIQLPNL